MKRSVLLVVLILSLIFTLSPLLAGENKVVEEEEKEQSSFDFNVESFRPSNGLKGNGGPAIGMILLDLNEFNQILDSVGFRSMKEEVILFGGGGLGGFKGGARFGGIGMSGSNMVESKDDTCRDKIVLELNYGGFLFEQGIYASHGTDVAIGGIIGGGSILVDRIGETPHDFEEALGDLHSTSLQKDFILIKPMLSIHQQLMSFIGVSLSVGYLAAYDMGGEWDFYSTDVSPSPLEFVHGPTANLRLSFGF